MAQELFDKRTDFFKRYFELGLPFDKYILTGTPPQKERWSSGLSHLQLTQSERDLLAAFKRTMNVIVLSGIWCGDCARQGPLLRVIEQASSVIEMRYLESHAHPELVDELRIQGGTRVPVVVTLSEDFWEISRFGDRTLSAYRQKVARELGPACAVGSSYDPNDLRAELTDWLEHFERDQLLLVTSPFLRKRYRD